MSLNTKSFTLDGSSFTVPAGVTELFVFVSSPGDKIYNLLAKGVTNAHYLALDTNGKAWAWGTGANGRLGDNRIANNSLPVSVHQGALTFTQISAGTDYSLALDSLGQAWAWGAGTSGKLGVNNLVSYSVPVSVHQGALTFTQILAGNTHSMALDSLGQAWAWGSNNAGKLGVNNLVSYSVPVSVHQGTLTFTQISAGGEHSLALDSLGQAWAWGSGGSGSLGNNSIVSVSVPVSVHQGALTFTQVVAAAGHTLALDSLGQAWAWGTGTNGRLGNNDIASVSVPVSVHQGALTFTQIAGANSVSMAMDNSGRAWAWGNGYDIVRRILSYKMNGTVINVKVTPNETLSIKNILNTFTIEKYSGEKLEIGFGEKVTFLW